RRRRRPRGLQTPGQLIVLNRRVATRPTITGVARWATEVIGRLHACAPDRSVVAQPRPRARRRLLAQGWEQLALPAEAAHLRAALGVSPAHLAPLALARRACVLRGHPGAAGLAAHRARHARRRGAARASCLLARLPGLARRRRHG